tara:strand:- start:101 stop:559 length:459 start_codon:yes stop_codon:yes gene_type:complete
MSEYNPSMQQRTFTITEEALEADPTFMKKLTAMEAQNQLKVVGTKQGGVLMGMGSSSSSVGGWVVPLTINGPSISGMINQQTRSVDKSVPEAIERDLKAQGSDTGTDALRLARVAVRAIRDMDDKVFEAAGVNPKHHKDNFTKVIDQIMKGL